jgi:hypothetical protein
MRVGQPYYSAGLYFVFVNKTSAILNIYGKTVTNYFLSYTLELGVAPGPASSRWKSKQDRLLLALL